MPDLDELLSIPEAAEQVGRNPAGLQKAAQRGRLRAQLVGGTLVTTLADVTRYVAEVEAWKVTGRPRSRPINGRHL